MRTFKITPTSRKNEVPRLRPVLDTGKKHIIGASQIVSWRVTSTSFLKARRWACDLRIDARRDDGPANSAGSITSSVEPGVVPM